MKLSAPTRLFLHAVLNVALVWVLANRMQVYITITGGIGAAVIIGSLITLMNIIVRPLLALATFPLKLLATLLAFLLVNGIFVGLTLWIAGHMDATLVTMQINGIVGWLAVVFVVGLANWVMKILVK